MAKVRDRGVIHIGLLDGSTGQSAKTQRFVRRIAQAAKAKPVFVTGQEEPLLLRLEEGELDLVLGTFDQKTPWGTRVTVGPPLERIVTGQAHQQQLAPAMRNGENAWISLIEREVRHLAPEAQ